MQSGISLLVFIQGGRRVEVSCVRKRGPGQFCCVLLSAALTFALWFDGHVSDPPGLACETAAPMLSEPAPRAFSRSMSLQSPEAASAASAPSRAVHCASGTGLPPPPLLLRLHLCRRALKPIGAGRKSSRNKPKRHTCTSFDFAAYLCSLLNVKCIMGKSYLALLYDCAACSPKFQYLSFDDEIQPGQSARFCLRSTKRKIKGYISACNLAPLLGG